MNINAAIGACALAFAFVASNGAEAATHHHHRAGVEMEARSTAQFNTGAKLNVDAADVAARAGLVTPADSAPDYLHQQIFRVQR